VGQDSKANIRARARMRRRLRGGGGGWKEKVQQAATNILHIHMSRGAMERTYWWGGETGEGPQLKRVS